MTFESLIATYGYPAIFVGAVLEGETVLLIAAVLAQQGLLDFQGVVLASGLGAFAGDQGFYHLGRRYGRPLLSRRPRWRRKIERASAFLDRHPRTVILLYRFLYGFRAVIPYLLGTGRCGPILFTVLSGLSAALWSVVITTGGFYGERIFSDFVQKGMAAQKWLLLTAGAVVAVVLIGRHLQMRGTGQ
jgi:membrane protein DedA with SNARE-associated domain